MFRKKDFKWKDYCITNLYLPPKGVKKNLLEKISDFFEYHSTPRIGDGANPYRNVYQKLGYKVIR